MTRLPTLAIVAVVLLRLLTGWHFYNEGLKKLDPKFSSIGFLRNAKGPLAPTFRSLASGPYGAYAELEQPAKLGPDWAPRRLSQDPRWSGEVGEQPSRSTLETPGAGWAANLAASWQAGIKRLERLGLGGGELERVNALRDEKLADVVAYLDSLQPEIAEMQNEVWRLEQLKDEASHGAAPYLSERITAKSAEVSAAMRPWIAAVGLIEASFIEQTAEVAAGAGIGQRRVRSALTERSLINWIDYAVMVTVLGSGVCLFLGLGTPVFATLAALFLVSLMATQPPWVEGADLGAFFRWAIEAAALFVLAAVGAGAWAGLDGVLYRARRVIGDLSFQQVAPVNPTTAPAS